MKVFICLLAFAVSAHCGLLPHLEPPPLSHSDHSAHQIQETKIIKVIHETASLPHATLPTTPLKILKVIHESAANLPIPAAGPPKIIKVIHQSVSHVAPTPVSPPKVIKVIHQSAPVPAAGPVNAKLLKVIHEYAPRHHAAISEGQSTKILKIIRQQAAASPHPAAVGQDVKVFKVIRQLGGGGDLSSSASHGTGQTYASSYSHGHATPTSILKVIKVLEKPGEYPSTPGW